MCRKSGTFILKSRNVNLQLRQKLVNAKDFFYDAYLHFFCPL